MKVSIIDIIKQKLVGNKILLPVNTTIQYYNDDKSKTIEYSTDKTHLITIDDVYDSGISGEQFLIASFNLNERKCTFAIPDEIDMI